MIAGRERKAKSEVTTEAQQETIAISGRYHVDGLPTELRSGRIAPIHQSLLKATTVWWYIPAKDEIAALRSEHDNLQASVETLKQHGGRISMRDFGPYKWLCVQVDKAAGIFGTDPSKDVYMIAKGY